MFGAKSYLSYESDYFSAGFGVSATHSSQDKSRELSAEFEAFFDDLRWGQINEEDGPKLVYPEELRFKEWYDDYRRRTFNLNFTWQQTINKRTTLAIFPGVSYQHGILGTPFHRVYFKDSSERVENLPKNRIKVPIGFQLILLSAIVLSCAIIIAFTGTISASLRIHLKWSCRLNYQRRMYWRLLPGSIHKGEHPISNHTSNTILQQNFILPITIFLLLTAMKAGWKQNSMDWQKNRDLFSISRGYAILFIKGLMDYMHIRSHFLQKWYSGKNNIAVLTFSSL